jgi:hypothetical protein
MPVGQPLEVLVGRRGATYGVPAVYDGDSDGRLLTPDERLQVARATALVADAIAGEPTAESTLNDAVELLHRLSLQREGAPRLRLNGTGQLISGADFSYRARLSP